MACIWLCDCSRSLKLRWLFSFTVIDCVSHLPVLTFASLPGQVVNEILKESAVTCHII